MSLGKGSKQKPGGPADSKLTSGASGYLDEIKDASADSIYPKVVPVSPKFANKS